MSTMQYNGIDFVLKAYFADPLFLVFHRVSRRSGWGKRRKRRSCCWRILVPFGFVIVIVIGIGIGIITILSMIIAGVVAVVVVFIVVIVIVVGISRLVS